MERMIIISTARNLIFRASAASLILLVSGCGKSSHDSGGASNTFLGKQGVNITQSRITSDLRTTDFQLTRGENQITISDQGFTISAQLSGSEFKVTSPDIPVLNSDSGCSSFSLTYSGTISDTKAVGQISGVYDCVLPATINGSFDASNQTQPALSTLPSVYSIVVGG